jgi:hypothetical protein
MNAEIEVFLKDLNASETGEDWIEAMENYIDCFPNTAIDYLALDNTSFLIERGKTLLVVFESAEQHAQKNSNAFPTGWRTADSKGWSHLSIVTLQATQESSLDVIKYVTRQVKKGALAQFENVVFVGIAKTSTLAVACSELIAQSTVVLVHPDAAEESDAADQAPKSANTAKRFVIVSDPAEPVALEKSVDLSRSEVLQLNCRHMGYKTEEFVRSFGLMPILFDLATSETPDASAFYAKLRTEKRTHRAYWRNLLRKLDKDSKPNLTRMLCASVHASLGGRVFKRELERLGDNS